ncbi:MAG: class I SAM-dependent rRNA methyltransferase [bacterium]
MTDKQIILNESGICKRQQMKQRLFRSDIKNADGSPPDGAVVDLISESGDFYGRGFYSSESPIAVRMISRGKQQVDKKFFAARLQTALERRKNIFTDRSSMRVVNSAGDFLPGLIVDKFSDFLVTQFRNKAIASYGEIILDWLEEEFNPAGIYGRNDLAARGLEGLQKYSKTLRGRKPPSRVEVQREPYLVLTDIIQGQKTGYYLDQEFNRRRISKYSKNKTCLDCFSYAGGWGLSCLHGGAEKVVFVDNSERALDLVRENIRHNGWQNRAEVVCSDGFDYLNHTDRKFDLIVLDPPSFAHSDEKLEAARRGYKEINLRAMNILKSSGGVLATSSCTSPVDEEIFTEILTASAHDAHVTLSIREQHTQPVDHPWLINLPSSHYLNCIFGEVHLP